MSYAIWITQLTMVGLGEWDDQGNFVPELAAEVPTADNGGVSADGLTITWKLQDCLFWSDGEPLTSADVKFTWEPSWIPAMLLSPALGMTRSPALKRDDLTVVITFSALYPPWRTLFTQGCQHGAILPKHILEGQTALESNDFIHQPLCWFRSVCDHGMGARRLYDAVTSEFPLRARYPGSVQIRFVPDPATAQSALQTGDVDWFPNFQ